MTDSDLKLLESLRINNQAALKEIFKAHYPAVLSCIFRLIPQQAIAEDLSQEVFLRFWEKRTTINIKSSIAAYIRQMAVNEALGYLRKRKKMPLEPINEYQVASVHSSEDAYLHTEMQEQVHRAIDELPDRCRLIFLLSRFEQLSYKEISQKLDISPKTVENQISKALKSMRKAIDLYRTGLILICFLFF